MLSEKAVASRAPPPPPAPPVLDVIDALDLGTPVVATDYSGTRDLATAETAWLVDVDMCAANTADYSFVEPGQFWADPRPDSAIRAMRNVAINETERDRRIRRGKDLVSSTATVQCFAARIASAVEANLGDAQAQRCAQG